MNLSEAKKKACNVGDRIWLPWWEEGQYMQRIGDDEWVNEEGNQQNHAIRGDNARDNGWEVLPPALPPRRAARSPGRPRRMKNTAENPDAKVVDGKDPLGWIPLTALAGVARQMKAGSTGGSQYPRGNFATALYDDATADRYVSAALRHLSKAQAAGGVWAMARLASQRDPDTQELEIDAVIANLLMLREVIARSGGNP